MDSDNLSVCLHKTCLTDHNHSMVTHGLISFETATPTLRASGRSPRGGEHGTNHTSSRTLCVELSELTFSIPIGEMGRAAAIARSRAAEKTLRQVYFQVELGKNHLCTTAVVLDAIRDKRRGYKKSSRHLRTIHFETTILLLLFSH